MRFSPKRVLKYAGIVAFVALMLYVVIRSATSKLSHVSRYAKQHGGHSRRRPLILLWTSYTQNGRWMPQLSRTPFNAKNCLATCEFTRDKSRFHDSDIVVARAGPIGTNQPMLPRNRSLWQRYVIFLENSPSYTHPDFLQDGVFNWTMTYRKHSDISIPYGYVYKLQQKRRQIKNHFQDSGVNRKNLVLWIVSRCNTESKRHKYALKLRKYIQVDIYGKCAVPCEQKQCGGIEKNYKFYLAFENSLCTDYISEKVYRSYEMGMIPIVLGGANYKLMLPPKSYINIADFKSPKQLADHLYNVSTNERLYNSYFQWKTTFNIKRNLNFMVGFCSLCQKAVKNRSLPRKEYNVREWWFHDTCTTPEKRYPHLADSVFNQTVPEEFHFGQTN